MLKYGFSKSLFTEFALGGFHDTSALKTKKRNDTQKGVWCTPSFPICSRLLQDMNESLFYICRNTNLLRPRGCAVRHDCTFFEQELNVTSGRVTCKQKATGPFAGINSLR